MSENPQILADSQNAEAVNAVAIAAEAAQKASASQMEAALGNTLERFFSRGVENKKYVDISRIPFLCDAVEAIDKTLVHIHETQKTQANDALWTKRIMIGIATVAGIIGLPLLSWMLITIIKNQTLIAVLNHAASATH